MFRLIR